MYCAINSINVFFNPDCRSAQFEAGVAGVRLLKIYQICEILWLTVVTLAALASHFCDASHHRFWNLKNDSLSLYKLSKDLRKILKCMVFSFKLFFLFKIIFHNAFNGDRTSNLLRSQEKLGNIQRCICLKNSTVKRQHRIFCIISFCITSQTILWSCLRHKMCR